MGNAAQHYLLNGLAGWRAASLSGAVLANAKARLGSVLTMQPLPGSGRPLVDAAGSLGGLEAAIGVAIDSEDRVYILDGRACKVKRFDRCLSEFITLPCVGGCGDEPRQLSSPHGMAMSCRDDLYIADTGNRRVQVFSVKGFALRAIWEPLLVHQSADGITVEAAVPTVQWDASGSNCHSEIVYPANTWRPWDIAIAKTSWSYVTDHANGLIHVFDPRGSGTLRGLGGAGPLSK